MRLPLVLIAVLFFPVLLKAQVAPFTVDDDVACIGQPVHFTPNVPWATSCQWAFNGGFADDTASCSPTVIWLQSGQYNVTLIACDGAVCDTFPAPNFMTIVEPPDANFSFEPIDVCNPFEVQFTDLSTAGDASILEWVWELGQINQFSFDQNPVHVYPAPATYTVNLSVIDTNGCSDGIAVAVNVDAPVNVTFGATDTLSCEDSLSA